MKYFSKDDVLNLLNRNSITKKITLADGVSIYDSVKNLPTADVVPKSEVDRLTVELEAVRGSANCYKMHYKNAKQEIEKLQGDLVVWKQNRFNIFQSIELYDKTRAKVAREIFEEIEKLKHTKWDWNDYVDWDAIAVLKKKYTGSEDKE